ncbi:MAG: type II toxin-antitoxin system prevent-host-death family antitoxin [Dehalococcoidales bacterium]|nr:type II toxin-antitoxin system prevent-host-death family antitoxin [Dehalococcoidales bacterium]
MVGKTTYSNARQSLKALCDEVVSTREPVYITRRGAEDVALISADELDSIMETVHLLRSPENARRLLTALTRAYENSEKPSSIEELKQELGIERE